MKEHCVISETPSTLTLPQFLNFGTNHTMRSPKESPRSTEAEHTFFKPSKLSFKNFHLNTGKLNSAPYCHFHTCNRIKVASSNKET